MTRFNPLLAADLGPAPTLEWLDIDDLYVDKRYQRATTSTKSHGVINKILHGFCWSKFQPPTVACIEDKDGEIKYAVVDGPDRLLACIQHPQITQLPCYIITADEISEQAESFIAINKNRVNITQIAIFHAALAAGDPNALRVKKICDKSGILISTHTNTKIHKSNETIAVVVITHLSGRKHGEYIMDMTLTALRLSSGGGGSMLKAHLIKAVFAIEELNFRRATFDQDRLVTALQTHTSDGWRTAAIAYCKALNIKSMPARITLIASAYNKGLKKDKMITELEQQ